MSQLLLATGLALGALAIAAVLQRRKPAAPMQGSFVAPTQLDRQDFAYPEAPWLIAEFMADTCLVCDEVWKQVDAIDQGGVAIEKLEVNEAKLLHDRYRIDGVPTTVLADSNGVVRASWVGPIRPGELADTVRTLVAS